MPKAGGFGELLVTFPAGCLDAGLKVCWCLMLCHTVENQTQGLPRSGRARKRNPGNGGNVRVLEFERLQGLELVLFRLKLERLCFKSVLVSNILTHRLRKPLGGCAFCHYATRQK